jgi:hypothetical protein
MHGDTNTKFYREADIKSVTILNVLTFYSLQQQIQAILVFWEVEVCWGKVTIYPKTHRNFNLQ